MITKFAPNNLNLIEMRRQSRTSAITDRLERKLDDIRSLLDQGLAFSAQKEIPSLLKNVSAYPILVAKTRCALAISYEMQGRYRESLEAVAQYEAASSWADLDISAFVCVRTQAALAYNYLSNQPKAIAILNSTLREVESQNSDSELGTIFVALARVYRSINEYSIARDYAQQALQHFRKTGDWRGLSEAWFGLAMANYFEGRWEAALDNLEQARTLIGDRSANNILGKIYNNMAGACGFLKRPQESITYLEKAISYYERTEHKSNAMDGYNNLGDSLILVGEWDRAQIALEKALAYASEIDGRRAEVAMILDSLGKLQMLRGNLDEAKSLLEKAVATATEHGNKWYEGQALRTMCQCLLAMNQSEEALQLAQKAFALGEKIGDRQAIFEAKLFIIEAQFPTGNPDQLADELIAINDETKESPADLAISGNAQRLSGILALKQKDYTRAANHFGRAISTFELLGDVFKSARAHYWLGCAYSHTQPERAADHLEQARNTFKKLSALNALAQADEALAVLDRHSAPTQEEIAQLVQLLTMRLSEASTSRELLLRELAAVIKAETTAQKIVIFEANPHTITPNIVVSKGWNEIEASELIKSFEQTENGSEWEKNAQSLNVSLFRISPVKAKPAVLLIAPRGSARLPFGLAIDSLLRVVELGLNTCALHEKDNSTADIEIKPVAANENLLSGFIHSSPAMTKLVEEIHRIRSSDVTALITGESGTGKELVARAIHSLSSRRAKVFVPFNCTAVPKELSDAFLFGYKKGAFTGAVADSAGVIRAAEGGTLFLDEVGDLPLDIQPKLLRFLQEGEIQPLGEQRPMKVDVRIIAATNSDLEEMVAAGRFREDLYYRLNVIRLKVPPLRERRSEIPAIVNHYVQNFAEKFGRKNIQITPQAMDLLMVGEWPGNVRQLTNEIQRIVARGEDGLAISPDHLSQELRRNALTISNSQTSMVNGLLSPQFWENLTIAEAVDQFKSHVIVEALRKNAGNVSRTARELGLTRRGLQLLIVRYAIRD